MTNTMISDHPNNAKLSLFLGISMNLLSGYGFAANLHQLFDDLFGYSVRRPSVRSASGTIKRKYLFPVSVIDGGRGCTRVDSIHADRFLPRTELNPVFITSFGNIKPKVVASAVLVELFEKQVPIPLGSRDRDLNDFRTDICLCKTRRADECDA